ncbi:DUF2399 domain-containing protein [Kribbella qitaiheensis]|uniref:DUF2399 domain-containing protein n=1 Tax=Kribbella qitaiheensis TaxID=1544730 RepID=A0A7G6WW64_9ACTN|nr:TIGR02679 domain-containing protein [Kribbella qitaiheensis]QNE18229.1 DUF2399 domain-containing protein [Kribbella qitaiheensis]
MGVDLDLIASDPELRPLWDSLHERLSSGTAAAAISSVSIPDLSPGGVATLRAWLDTNTGRTRHTAVKRTQRGVTVPVRNLLARLGVSSDELGAFLERATGQPLTNRAAVRRQAADLRGQLWTYADARLKGYPQLVNQLRAVGLSGDDDTSVRQLIDALAEALAWVSTKPGPISLAKLAHDITGDPHYFDLKDLAGSRLLAGVAELHNQPAPTRPHLVRAFLASAGIIADRLLSTVLLHNVVAVGDGPIDRRLRDSANPVALTYLDLTSTPPTFGPQVLTVVENPSVLEAAMAAGARHAFACTSGNLGHVDHALLQLAADQRLDLRYSGDLDSAGHEIARTVVNWYGASPVAMSDQTAARAAAWRPVVDASHSAGATPTIYQEHDVVLRQILACPSASTSEV